MPETFDYKGLLDALEAEKQDIERIIVWVKSRMAQSGEVSVALTSATDTGALSKLRPPHSRFYGGGLPSDTFFRMSVPDAIKKYLNIMKRPQTAKEITAALDSGGLTHKAKNLYATVYPTLLRMEKTNEVTRTKNGEWALSDWYGSGGRKTNQAESGESEV